MKPKTKDVKSYEHKEKDVESYETKNRGHWFLWNIK